MAIGYTVAQTLNTPIVSAKPMALAHLAQITVTTKQHI